MKKLKLKSPAKINLTLEIKNKRPDNYHNIISIMQTVNIFDKIIIKKSENLTCCCNNKQIPSGIENSAIKAAIEFFKQTKINQKVKIKIFKKIPIQAGLGGGSSNAATVLIGLNTLFKTNLNNKQLCKIAKKIGADVPFFIFGKTALVQGLGEKITPLRNINLNHILIIKPKNLNISTKQAFLEHDLTQKNKFKNRTTNLEKLIEHISTKDNFSTYCKHFFNSFEESLSNDQIDTIKLTLKNSGAIFAMMSGSGSSVFGVFETIKLAKIASKKFPKSKFLKFLCKTT